MWNCLNRLDWTPLEPLRLFIFNAGFSWFFYSRQTGRWLRGIEEMWYVHSPDSKETPEEDETRWRTDPPQHNKSNKKTSCSLKEASAVKTESGQTAALSTARAEHLSIQTSVGVAEGVNFVSSLRSSHFTLRQLFISRVSTLERTPWTFVLIDWRGRFKAVHDGPWWESTNTHWRSVQFGWYAVWTHLVWNVSQGYLAFVKAAN